MLQSLPSFALLLKKQAVVCWLAVSTNDGTHVSGWPSKLFCGQKGTKIQSAVRPLSQDARLLKPWCNGHTADMHVNAHECD